MILRFALASALLAAIAAGPVAVTAQQYPPAPPEVGGSQPPPQAPPPGAPDQSLQPAPPVTGFHVRGVVAYSQPYFLMLDAGGSRIPVQLHDGTVILPTGLTLAAGMRLAIDGRWVKHSYGAPMFVADRIALIPSPPQPP